MTVLVDEARWWWGGRRWAHLVSDADLEELHHFARALGVRRISFGGDHYDVTESQREAALYAGAQAVGARELVRRLRASGLRRPAGDGPHRWQPLDETPWRPAETPGHSARLALGLTAGATVALEVALQRWAAGRTVHARVLTRWQEQAVVFSDPLGDRVVDRVGDRVGDRPGAVPDGPSEPGALPDPVAPISAWFAWPATATQGRSLEVFIATPNGPKTPGWMTEPPERPRSQGAEGR